MRRGRLIRVFWPLPNSVEPLVVEIALLALLLSLLEAPRLFTTTGGSAIDGGLAPLLLPLFLLPHAVEIDDHGQFLAPFIRDRDSYNTARASKDASALKPSSPRRQLSRMNTLSALDRLPLRS